MGLQVFEQSSTKDAVLFLLKKHGVITIRELSEKLNLTGNGVRKHIDTLDRYGYIETVLLRQRLGRPTHAYKLTDLAESSLFPNQYDQLLEELFIEIEDLYNDRFVNELLKRRMKKRQREYKNAMLGQRLANRVETLARLQDEKGYMVRVEKQSEHSYLLKEINCPVAKIAKRYRQVCESELSMFRFLLNTDVERIECIADGGKHCCYRIGEIHCI